jgi:hypothetical protein
MAQITLNSTGVASNGSLVLQSNGTTAAVTIDTSQRASFVAGTAALPAITTTGDTNTGIFFPAADTIAFSEGGAEAMRIDSSGNVGIGVTPSGWGSSYKAQQIGQAGVLSGHTSVPAMTLTSNAYENSGWKAITTSSAHRIDLSSDNNATIFYRAPSVSAGSGLTWSESMRIDSNGNLLVGTTVSPTATGTAGVQIVQSSGIGVMYIGKTYSGSTDAMRFYYNGGGSAVQVGSINYTNTATAFNTSSDYRLKENIQPMTGALAKVQALNPVTYTWKADGSDGEGFIAHELQAIVPNAVTGEKDATEIQQYEISPAVPATFDEEGNELTPAVEAVMGERDVPKYQGIDTSFLVATLTAAIQELKALVDTQASTITTLTDRITALEAK